MIGYVVTYHNLSTNICKILGVEILGVEILGVDISDILGVDILGVDVLGRTRKCKCPCFEPMKS